MLHHDAYFRHWIEVRKELNKPGEWNNGNSPKMASTSSWEYPLEVVTECQLLHHKVKSKRLHLTNQKSRFHQLWICFQKSWEVPARASKIVFMFGWRTWDSYRIPSRSCFLTRFYAWWRSYRRLVTRDGGPSMLFDIIRNWDKVKRDPVHLLKTPRTKH